MGFFNFIETFFFVSLGITFILILLLVYHFKHRLACIEQKSDTMFEIVNTMVKELTALKRTVVLQTELAGSTEPLSAISGGFAEKCVFLSPPNANEEPPISKTTPTFVFSSFDNIPIENDLKLKGIDTDDNYSEDTEGTNDNDNDNDNDTDEENDINEYTNDENTDDDNDDDNDDEMDDIAEEIEEPDTVAEELEYDDDYDETNRHLEELPPLSFSVEPIDTINVEFTEGVETEKHKIFYPTANDEEHKHPTEHIETIGNLVHLPFEDITVSKIDDTPEPTITNGDAAIFFATTVPLNTAAPTAEHDFSFAFTENEQKKNNREIYRKMNISQLRTLVISKGLISDTSGFKKNDLLKLLDTEDEL